MANPEKIKKRKTQTKERIQHLIEGQSEALVLTRDVRHQSGPTPKDENCSKYCLYKPKSGNGDSLQDKKRRQTSGYVVCIDPCKFVRCVAHFTSFRSFAARKPLKEAFLMYVLYASFALAWRIERPILDSACVQVRTVSHLLLTELYPVLTSTDFTYWLARIGQSTRTQWRTAWQRHILRLHRSCICRQVLAPALKRFVYQMLLSYITATSLSLCLNIPAS